MLARRLARSLFVGSLVLCGCDHGRLTPARLAKLERAIPPPQTAPGGRSNNEARGRADAVALGRFLFFSEAFSAEEPAARRGIAIRPRSCASCHVPTGGFDDGDRLSTQTALAGFTTRRNTPSIQYSTSRYFLFWNGRADSAWAQALGPMEHPIEMASNRLRVVKTLASDPELASAYESIFGPLPDLDAIPYEDALPPGTDLEPLPPEFRGLIVEWQANWQQLDEGQRAAVDNAFANVGKAIAAYEDALAVRDSPFDRFMAAVRAGASPTRQGELDGRELRGLALFVEEGCLKCHRGPDLTDEDFHDIVFPDDPGVDGGWRAGATTALASPFNCEGPHGPGCDAQAKRNLRRARRQSRYRIMAHRLRTPTLRQLGETAPYGSLGQFDTLEEVVEFYVELPEPDPSVRPHSRDRRRNKLLDMMTFNTVHAADLDAEEAAAMVAFLRTLDSPAPCDDLVTPPRGPSDPIDVQACGL